MDYFRMYVRKEYWTQQGIQGRIKILLIELIKLP